MVKNTHLRSGEDNKKNYIVVAIVLVIAIVGAIIYYA